MSATAGSSGSVPSIRDHAWIVGNPVGVAAAGVPASHDVRHVHDPGHRATQYGGHAGPAPFRPVGRGLEQDCCGGPAGTVVEARDLRIPPRGRCKRGEEGSLTFNNQRPDPGPPTAARQRHRQRTRPRTRPRSSDNQAVNTLRRWTPCAAQHAGVRKRSGRSRQRFHFEAHPAKVTRTCGRCRRESSSRAEYVRPTLGLSVRLAVDSCPAALEEGAGPAVNQTSARPSRLRPACSSRPRKRRSLRRYRPENERCASSSAWASGSAAAS
jgi:hypothetical protein